MSDCFGPEAGGVPDRPASPTTANDLWATGESVCGAGDGSYILGLINSIIANLRNICRAAAGQTLINDDPCDSVIVAAIRQLPCTQTPATAAQIAALKVMPANSTILVCIGGDVVAVPADCFIEPENDDPCPPASDFTISADGVTATYNGTETNVRFCYFDNMGNEANILCFPIAAGDTISLSHANFDPLVSGSGEIVVNGTAYSGVPPSVPGGSTVPLANLPPGLTVSGGVPALSGDCPGIILKTTQPDGAGGMVEITSVGAFSYA